MSKDEFGDIGFEDNMTFRRSIAVMTSGGDCQGMNPAVRAVVRSSIRYNIDVYAIYEGFAGLADESTNYISKLCWDDVSTFLSLVCWFDFVLMV